MELPSTLEGFLLLLLLLFYFFNSKKRMTNHACSGVQHGVPALTQLQQDNMILQESIDFVYMDPPVFRSHKYCIKYAFCKFSAVSRKLSTSIISNTNCISFDLFISICYFCM